MVCALFCSTVGQIPGDLAGQFIRNGPNPHFVPAENYHWFDGDVRFDWIEDVHGVAFVEWLMLRSERWRRRTLCDLSDKQEPVPRCCVFNSKCD